MVEGLLVVCLLLIFAIGYYAMGKLDLFLAKPDTFPEGHLVTTKENPVVIVFGCSTLADKLLLFLQGHGKDCIQIEDENQLDRTNTYSHLFAISDNDLDNLMMSVIASKMLGINENIAVCNCLDNLTIFKQNNLRCIYGGNITEETLFHTMFFRTDKQKESNGEY